MFKMANVKKLWNQRGRSRNGCDGIIIFIIIQYSSIDGLPATCTGSQKLKVKNLIARLQN